MGNSTKQIALPFGVLRTSAARRASLRNLALGILIIAAVAGVLAYAVSNNVAVTAAVAGTVAVLAGWLCRRGFSTASRNGDPEGSLTISAARIRCAALVDGDFSWSDLTAFRWVLQQEKNNATVFERSDGAGADQLPARGFIVEAAELRDPAQGNEFGYYDRAAIQFNLDDVCLTSPTRQDANAVITMLNGMQAAAAAGTLRDGDTIELPAILNAVAPVEGAQRRTESMATVVRR
jgi:hypothetical protein